MTLKVLYTTHADASGGRNGRTKSADGVVDVALSVPKAMGGAGLAGSTTPEDLFAAGYAACFGSAAEFVSKHLKLSPTAIHIHCEVSIGSRDSGGFGLAVRMQAKVSGLDQAQAEQLIAKAHEVCPYSNAIGGNVEVALQVIAD
jgi:lipoyl-dependent peroxiredoxin